jgi:hypothetical protein
MKCTMIDLDLGQIRDLFFLYSVYSTVGGKSSMNSVWMLLPGIKDPNAAPYYRRSGKTPGSAVCASYYSGLLQHILLPGMACMPVLQEQKPVIKKAGQTHKMAHTDAVTLIQRFGSALKRSQGAIFNSRRLAPVGVKGRDSPE